MKTQTRQAAAAERNTAPDENEAIAIYTNVLNTLSEALAELLSPRVHMSLDTADGSAKAEYAVAIREIEKTRLGVGNAILSEISAKLEAGQEELKAGEDELRNALRSLDAITTALTTVSGYARIVGRIAGLI